MYDMLEYSHVSSTVEQWTLKVHSGLKKSLKNNVLVSMLLFGVWQVKIMGMYSTWLECTEINIFHRHYISPKMY